MNARERFLAVMQTGGHVPLGDHFVPPEVDWENFSYYRRALNGLIECPRELRSRA